jgi:hypothetical protein
MQKSGEKAGVLPAISLCANGNPVLPIAEKGASGSLYFMLFAIGGNGMPDLKIQVPAGFGFFCRIFGISLYRCI